MKQEPEGFADFWAVWRPHARHTDGRGLAREAFAKHLKSGACAQDMIDGAKYFFRTMKERDKEFVPLSATWLNRGAYEDMAEAERAIQQRVIERQKAAAPNVVTLQPPPREDPAKREEMAARLRQVANSLRAPS